MKKIVMSLAVLGSNATQKTITLTKDFAGSIPLPVGTSVTIPKVGGLGQVITRYSFDPETETLTMHLESTPLIVETDKKQVDSTETRAAAAEKAGWVRVL